MHHLSTVLELLQTLGAASWQALWLPVLLWTAVALMAVAALRLAPALPPLWTYRFRQALLAALPVGILAATVVDLPVRSLPTATFSAPALTSTSVQGAAASPDTLVWTWTHAVGLLTFAATVAAGYSVSKLCIELVRTRLMAASIRHGLVHSHLTDSAHNQERHSQLQSRTDTLRDRLGIRRAAQPVVADDVDSPMLLLGWSPLLVMPAWILGETDQPAAPSSIIDMSIVHELVHLDRYDDWAALAEQCIASLGAIHPLVHVLLHDIQLSRETACDAAVLSALRCERGTYARLLTNVATRQRTVPSVALSESTSSLQERLRAMKTPIRNASSGILRFVSIGVFSLLIVGMVACADGPSSTDLSEADTQEQTASADDVVKAGEMSSDAFKNPTLVGGLQAVIDEISYPESARESGTEGRVFVQFTVLKDGSVQDVEVKQGVSPELDAEAKRAIKQVSFEPGTMNGEPKPVRMTLPITFKLPDKG